jgi:TonB family protein
MRKFTIINLLLLISAISLRAQDVHFVNFKDAENAGGKSEFNRLFKQELLFPQKALLEGVGGKSTWKFKINPDGTLSDFALVSSAGEELDAEALRLIKIMDWKPAEKGSSKMESMHEFSISFDPKKYPGMCKKRGYTEIPHPVNPYDTSLEVFEKTDKKPKFDFNDEDLGSFLKKNLKYPKEAAVKEITGTVVVSFIVEASGMVTNIHVDQHVGGGCSEEAVRLVGLTKWTPGIKNGMAVRTRMKLPIGFNMNQSVRNGMNQEQRTN